jgi:hypothetical protein
MRTLEGRARNVSSLINSSATNSCGGPSKSGFIQASAYPRIPKGTLLARAPDAQSLVCSMAVGARGYKFSAPMKLLG